MFQEADCLLITKMDLAPHLEVNLKQIENNVREINPHVTIIPVSGKTGEGLNIWLNWVLQTVGKPNLLAESNVVNF
uniref:GTP-binding protein n=1 Tax=Dactylococcopsis salina TaxID=292566 RepID=UPI0003036501